MSIDLPPVPPRLAPELDFPPYSYVSGKFSHPTRDPSGHSFGREEVSAAFDPEGWRDCPAYCFGLDLFNAGYYWEAHESWEAAWHGVGRSGASADFLKGLIKLAAAGVKAREGRPQGVARHAARARELFEHVVANDPAAGIRYAGLSLAELLQAAEQLQHAPESVVNTSERPVQRVMPFVLQASDAAA